MIAANDEIKGRRDPRRRIPFSEVNNSGLYPVGVDQCSPTKTGTTSPVDTTPLSCDTGLEDCQGWTPTKAFDSDIGSPTFSSPQSLASSNDSPTKRLVFDCTHLESVADAHRDSTKNQSSPRSASQASRGLRHMSVALCQTLQRMGTTNYTEISEHMVREVQEEKGDGKHDACDEKNVRRRVYDSLNVLLATGIIVRRDKEITWQGMPNEAHQEYSRLMAESLELRKRIAAKHDALREQLAQQLCYRNLVIHNQRREHASRLPVDKIPTPFIVVNAHPFTEIHCDSTRDQTQVKLDMNAPFAIHDDTSILQQMGFDKAPLSMLQEMFPGDLLTYCDQKGLLNDILPETRYHSNHCYRHHAPPPIPGHRRPRPLKRAKPETGADKRHR